MGEHHPRHIRMAHQVVRAADQLIAIETADLDEFVVTVGDMAIDVRGGDQTLLGGKATFPAGQWHVAAHSVLLDQWPVRPVSGAWH
ncbi:hypothetical protein D3C81_1554250 [compost metagenome]